VVLRPGAGMHCLAPRSHLFTRQAAYLLVDELIHADRRARNYSPGRIVPDAQGVTGS